MVFSQFGRALPPGTVRGRQFPLPRGPVFRPSQAALSSCLYDGAPQPARPEPAVRHGRLAPFHGKMGKEKQPPVAEFRQAAVTIWRCGGLVVFMHPAFLFYGQIMVCNVQTIRTPAACLTAGHAARPVVSSPPNFRGYAHPPVS